LTALGSRRPRGQPAAGPGAPAAYEPQAPLPKPVGSPPAGHAR